MNREARYQEWLEALFDQDEAYGEWLTDKNEKLSGYDQAEVVEQFTLLCKNFEKDAAQYSNWQLSMGITYLLDGVFSDYPFALRDRPISIKARVAAIESIKQLYVQCFNKRCNTTLSHQAVSENPLNSICYKLWSATPLTYMRKHPDKEVLSINFCEVMEYCATLSNPACVESGIRGLSKLSRYFPIAKERLQAIIDSETLTNKSLRDYAEFAVTQPYH